MSTVVTGTHELTDAEHAALAGFLAQQAGLVFDQSRRRGLSSIITERLAATGAADLGAYLAQVSSPGGEDERQTLLDAVTIPETHFFRNPPQMAALERRLMPELLRRAVARGRPLTIWSAGCSTGEEAYSLAIIAREVAATLPQAPEIRVVATDLSSQAVASARRGRYRGRSLTLVDDARLRSWFAKQKDGSYAVVPEIRDLVDARLHNLVADAPPFEPGEVDLVVCRNVTIYFARDTMRDLVGRFHGVLAAGGYLLVGHAETLWQVTDAFTLVTLGDAFAYRKDVAASLELLPEPLRVEPEPPRRVVRRAPDVGGQYPDAHPKPRLPVDSVPDPDHANDLLRLAREALEQTRYAEAARLAAAAAHASPFEVDAYLVEGRARATVGDDEGSLVALRKAVYLAPTNGHARFLLAGALARCGEHAAAAREYRAAAQTLPESSPQDLDDLLDGCDVGELVTLCQRLAAENDLRAAGTAS